MKSMNHFRATKLPTESLSDNQRIIRDYTDFSIYLELIGDKTLTFHQLAGEFKRYCDSGDPRFRKMPTREEFGYALLRLTQERLLEMI